MNDRFRKEMRKFLDEEILGNPPLSSKEYEEADNILTKILGSSTNEKAREEFRDFLKIWEIRSLFVDALQEAKDEVDEEEREKGRRSGK